MRVFIPGAPPLDLEKFSLPARALATRFMFVLLSNVFGTHVVCFLLL